MLQTSCFDIWKKEEKLCKIITLCKDLDAQLGGGIPLRMVSELCGASGSGKTQMCLQLSINVQFPKEVGGFGGCALYVDTNQDFNPERLKEIAECMEQRFQQTFVQQCNNSRNSNLFNAASILENISYIYCADYVELIATVEHMKVLVEQNPQLKLIIIDSFSFAIRCVDEVSKRSNINYELLTDLQQLALDNDIAIVITNELTTRIMDNNSKICPALGESHTHKINQRILLSKSTNSTHHIAYIDKCLLSPKMGVSFVIKQSGIRGIN